MSFVRHLTAVGATTALLLSTGSLGAQAICSAPHSSPTLAQSGSLSTLPQGGGWIQFSAYGQRADQFFSPSGSRQSFLANSEFTTRSAFFTGAVGILDGVEIWAQVPVHNLRVQGQGGNRVRPPGKWTVRHGLDGIPVAGDPRGGGPGSG